MQTKTQPDELQTYLTDASNMQGGHAEKLFLPESADEVAAVLREANAKGKSVTISGARTGTVGGAIPFGGYVISLEKLNKIKSIDRDARTAIVEPGVILGDLQKSVEAERMFYPPDPTEWSCQVGGTVATNASGSRSFKYGATREYVRALSIVLPDGDHIGLRRGEVFAESGVITFHCKSGREFSARVPDYERPDVRKNVSGYFSASPLDAIDLFIGSEGTLGIITEIELALLSKPEGFFSGVVFFENENELLAFVDEAKSHSMETIRNPVGSDKIGASLLEYFDDRSLAFIREQFPEVPVGLAGAVFFEQETTVDNEDVLFERWNEILEKHNADSERSWFTTSDGDREKMRNFRHALPVAVNERITKYGQRKIGTDMAVPDVNFQDFLQFYKDKLRESGLDYVIFGHIGDCHLHANMLPKNDDEALAARRLYGRFISQAIMLGGTVSAEHGIGKLKRKYLSAMMGERYLNEMAELKRAFDPKGILGRGNMFAEEFLK